MAGKSPGEKALSFPRIKQAMAAKYLKNTDAEIIQEDVDLTYCGSDFEAFFCEAEKLYGDTRLTTIA